MRLTDKQRNERTAAAVLAGGLLLASVLAVECGSPARAQQVPSPGDGMTDEAAPPSPRGALSLGDESGQGSGPSRGAGRGLPTLDAMEDAAVRMAVVAVGGCPSLDGCPKATERARAAVPVILRVCKATLSVQRWRRDSGQRCLSVVGRAMAESTMMADPEGSNDGGRSAGWYQFGLPRWGWDAERGRYRMHDGQHLVTCGRDLWRLDIDVSTKAGTIAARAAVKPYAHDLTEATRCYVYRAKALMRKVRPMCGKVAGDPWPYALRALGVGRWEGCGGTAATQPEGRCETFKTLRGGTETVCSQSRVVTGKRGPQVSPEWAPAVTAWRRVLRAIRAERKAKREADAEEPTP